MVQDSVTVTFEKTDSVLEALVLEAHLIQKHKPRYNAEGKDNKSNNFVVITKEDFPRVLIIRERDILTKNFDYTIKYSFGPFTQGKSLKEAMRIIRKIFPYRDKCIPSIESGKTKPCFNYQIGLCPGVCIGAVYKKEYQKQIQHIKLFFEGKKKKIEMSLKSLMKQRAKEKKFEEAIVIKKQLFALAHINDVSLISEDIFEKDSVDIERIEAYDIAHMGGKDVVGVMVVIENGEAEKNEYRKFKIKGGTGNNDPAALREVLERRLAHGEWRMPHIIVVDGSLIQKNIAEKVVSDLKLSIQVVAVTKDDKHKAVDIKGEKEIINKKKNLILLSNSEAHRFAIAYHRKTRRKNFK